MAETIRVEVLWSPGARDVREWVGELAHGATVLVALQASGLAAPDGLRAGESFGIWGRKCRPDRVLRDGDRVEVYRPLVVDPKLARRERFRKQGAGTAGLFAQRRPGAKAGY